MDWPAPIDRRLFSPKTPEEAFFDVLTNIDPKATLYRDRDYRNFADRFTVRWKTLGLRFGVTRLVTDNNSMAMSNDELARAVTDHLINEIINAIIEAYVEFWHLYYAGDKSLQEFTEMYGDDYYYYIESNGEYLGGITYARVCRLQQRDAGRYIGTERLIGEDSGRTDEPVRSDDTPVRYFRRFRTWLQQ